jgi:hypothetical protein
MRDPSRLRPINTITVMVETETERIDVQNPMVASGLLMAAIGAEMAREREKRIASTLFAAPGKLNDVLREEFVRQLSATGRFQVVDADADAIAMVDLCCLQLVRPLFESRERLQLDIILTIWDRNGQAIWYAGTGVYNDDRAPLLDSSDYEEDPVAAFEAYSAAIRIAVSNLINSLQAAPED